MPVTPTAPVVPRHLDDRTAPMPAVPREGKHRRTLLTPKKVTVAALVKQHTAAAS